MPRKLNEVLQILNSKNIDLKLTFGKLDDFYAIQYTLKKVNEEPFGRGVRIDIPEWSDAVEDRICESILDAIASKEKLIAA